MALKKDTGTAEPSPPDASTCLTPKTPQDAIRLMLKGYGEYPDQDRISFYVDTLDDCTTAEIWGAIKTWRRQPMDRAAKAGELRSMILTAREDLASIQKHEDEWAMTRITPEEKKDVLKTLTPEARAFLAPIFRQTSPALLKVIEDEAHTRGDEGAYKDDAQE